WADDFVSVVLTGTQFLSNSATSIGGGALFSGDASLTNTIFLGNSASDGGGLWYGNNNVPRLGRIANSLFARNQATGAGGAAEIALANSGTTRILHTTIADSALNPKPAIVSITGTLGITDSIIVSHNVGISVTRGSGYEDYNLLFGNTTNTFGAVTSGGHDVFLNPQFVNPAADNYHLSSSSPAIDAGTNVGIAFDIDGEPRPIGAGFDMGYDERNGVAFKLYLPLVVR
ncbi:MAG: hypothetical protein LC737_07835, partial [Chloroflexi bacterium]|nr:hypothetical protein [Chloroflexota bacterium]